MNHVPATSTQEGTVEKIQSPGLFIMVGLLLGAFFLVVINLFG